MRILSLGFPMPGPQVDNHTFANAPSFFDYDAIVVDPLALSQLIDEVVAGNAEHTTRSREPVANTSTGQGAVGLAALLRDRRDETARLLARGGLVVCFAYPNVVHQAVTGFSGCDRYFWLPTPPGIEYSEPALRRGTGTEIAPTEQEHPFGPYCQQFRGKLAYHAYFADDTPGRVFARSAGGAVVGVDLTLDRGRVVFLPPPARPPAGEQRYAFSNAIQAAIRRTLRLASTASPPAWLRQYDVPGLSERLASRDEAQQEAAESQEALATSVEAVAELESYRRLLWQEGTYGLAEPVRAALGLLGFQVVAQDIDTPAELWLEAEHHTNTIALLEVDASDEAVGMDGHHRLRHRLEEAIAAGKSKRGLLIINGYRTQPPDQRQRQYQDSLAVAAKTMRYCVTTAEQLFHAVRATLEGDKATARAFRDRLLSTEGVLQED